MAETAFYKYGRKLMNYKIMFRTRLIILNALVRSRLIYGCQVWTLSRRQIDQLNSIYYKMLRKMVRGGFNRRNADAEEWSFKITNLQLLEICKTESIESFIKRQQQKYLAHLIRQTDDSITKRAAFNNNVVKRPGRQITFIKSALGSEMMIHEFAQQAKLNEF